MSREAMRKLVWLLLAVLAALLILAIYVTDYWQDHGYDHQNTQLTTGSQVTTLPAGNVDDTSGQSESEKPPISGTVNEAPRIYPDKVGLYIPAADGTKARKMVTEFTCKRTAKKDIDCFEVIASDKARLEGSSFSGIWKAAWNAHQQTDGARIGFHISFSLQDGSVVDKLLLKPSDSKEFYDYLEIYMYDDIHQTSGVWYTHLEDKDMKEDTIISSIKLTSGSKIAQVGDIRLTAFIYNADAQVENGVYSGDVSATVVIPK